MVKLWKLLSIPDGDYLNQNCMAHLVMRRDLGARHVVLRDQSAPISPTTFTSCHRVTRELLWVER